MYSVLDNTIYVKEYVYIECANNVGRSRFTLTHELAHFILFKLLGFAINNTDINPKTYEQPEWQADTLAAELLVPYDDTKNYTVEEIMTECNVSEECAIVVYRKRKKLSK